MAITYRKMWGMVHERGLKWKDIKQGANVSNDVIAKINKNEYVNLRSLEKISEFLECDIGDIVERKKKDGP